MNTNWKRKKVWRIKRQSSAKVFLVFLSRWKRKPWKRKPLTNAMIEVFFRHVTEDQTWIRL